MLFFFSCLPQVTKLCRFHLCHNPWNLFLPISPVFSSLFLSLSLAWLPITASPLVFLTLALSIPGHAHTTCYSGQSSSIPYQKSCSHSHDPPPLILNCWAELSRHFKAGSQYSKECQGASSRIRPSAVQLNFIWESHGSSLTTLSSCTKENKEYFLLGCHADWINLS